MRYFVTGGTGFIGRHLVEHLVRREGDIHLLVLPSELPRFEALRARLDPDGTRLHAVVGDIGEPGLGLPVAERERLRGAQVFHLAAIYNLLAGEEETVRANVDGTRHVVELANLAGAACVHHMSSIAVAGRYRGHFTEAMFDERQVLDHPYFRTKYEAEAVVRRECHVPHRIYRPAMVIGSSTTGEADRVDGPYYAFKLIQKLRDALPAWVPLVGPEGGPFNIVPVDFVAAALDHIAHQPGLDGGVFHLVDPNPLSLGDILNTFCRAAHAPEFAARLDRHLLTMVPADARKLVGASTVATIVRDHVLKRFGVPEAALGYIDYPCTFDATAAQAALAGSGITVPPLSSYAWRIWDYWERHLDPDSPTEVNLTRAVRDRVVVVTGGASGIGRELCRRVAAAGAVLVVLDRDQEGMDALRAEIEGQGARCFTYPVDLTDVAGCRAVVERIVVDHGDVDVLVNCAGKSIRRSVMNELDRFHDFERTMQINYFGAVALILAVLPRMVERHDGHIVNISSIGVQTHPGRFAAYVASKSALDGFSTCLGAEVAADGVAITTVHMPLVRTPMTAPTSIYRSFPLLDVEEAADLVVRALITRPIEVSSRLGKFAEVMTAISPDVAQLVNSIGQHIMPETAKPHDGSGRPHLSPEAFILAQLLRGVHL